MSKGRAILKYSTAGAITAGYALAAREMLCGREPKKVSGKQAVIVTGVLTGLTWIATLA